MMLALAAAQAFAAPPPGDPPVADEVTVIGRRLKNWRGKVSTTVGITTCRTTVSTGDREIDAVGCAALKTCWSEYRPRYAATLDAKNKPAALEIEAALGQCLKTRRDALVADLVERRAMKRIGS